MVANSTHEDLRKMSETGGALESLGTVNFSEKAGRDAIHIAVFPAIAGERLFPGQHVGLDLNGEVSGSRPLKRLGVIDPYVEGVNKGDRVWILLYPRTITGLRHVWTHPDFENEVVNGGTIEVIEPAPAPQLLVEEPKTPLTWRDKVAAHPTEAAWVEGFCDNQGVSFSLMMKMLDSGEDYVRAEDWDYGLSWDGGEYITSLGTDAYGTIPDEFWDKVEVILDKKFPKRAEFFSCSC